jgi:hypothetical protein
VLGLWFGLELGLGLGLTLPLTPAITSTLPLALNLSPNESKLKIFLANCSPVRGKLLGNSPKLGQTPPAFASVRQVFVKKKIVGTRGRSLREFAANDRSLIILPEFLIGILGDAYSILLGLLIGDNSGNK